jgi:hypothetical protein
MVCSRTDLPYKSLFKGTRFDDATTIKKCRLHLQSLKHGTSIDVYNNGRITGLTLSDLK